MRCDSCCADLSDAGPKPSYYIRLKCEEMPTTSPITLTIAVLPYLERDYLFCDLTCLQSWFMQCRPSLRIAK